MLSAAALIPSSPLLIRSVNKDQRTEIEATEQALDHLADDWYARSIETVIIITQSRFAYDDAISIDIADPYLANLEELGDLNPQEKYHPDFHLIDALQRATRAQNFPVTLSTEQALPFSCAAPLLALAQRIRTLRVIPIAIAPKLDAKEHYQFGILLKNVIDASPKRVGVLAAGDISLTHLAELKVILEEKSIASLLKLAPELEAHVEDSSYRPLAVLFGVLDHTPTRAEILSIESPFTTGLIVASFS